MIISYINGEWKEPGSLCQAVGIYKGDFHKIVSVVGGGGKTTVIRAMFRECMENSDGRIPCAVSTTTHIQKTNAEYFLGEPSMKCSGRSCRITKLCGWGVRYGKESLHHSEGVSGRSKPGTCTFASGSGRGKAFSSESSCRT